MLSTAFRLYVAEQVGALNDPEAAFAEAVSAVSGNFGVAVIWCFSCTSAAAIGDPMRVERCARLVLEAEAGETLGFWGSQARMYLGARLTATGRADEGRPLFESGFTDFRAAGMRVGAALILAAAASAEVLAGDLERATHHLRAAQEELLVGERYAQPAVLLAAADVAEASGASADEVRHQRQEAETIALSQGAVAVAERARAAQRGECWIGVDTQAPAANASSSSPSSA